MTDCMQADLVLSMLSTLQVLCGQRQFQADTLASTHPKGTPDGEQANITHMMHETKRTTQGTKNKSSV